ncbi:unnamed protein product [Paramecium sonneborni]|uniref:Tetraspanin family protein n=1 Tax=Paramecium sonneborni TaxID=65129 RepID=A0A8S1PSC8_9CILI|nr:unnamed protein product [Paramecium sonneborni]
MCLPISCLKCIVEVEAIIILIVGLCSFGFTIYLQIQYSSYNENEQGDQGIGTVAIFWIISVAMILNGIIGIIGGKKKSSCLLFLFNMVNIVILLGFIALMILGYVLANEIQDFNQEEYCAGEPSLQQTWLLGQNLICSSNCPCYINNQQTIPPFYLPYSSSNSSDATKVQDCPQYKSWSDSQKAQAQFFRNIEKNQDCSGWCSPFSLKIFYDINSNLNQNTQQCTIEAQQSLVDTCQIIGDTSAALTGIMGLLVIFTFCLCCHPTRKDQKSYYERLAYQND